MDNDLANKINDIRDKADIVDVVSRYINVVHKGKNYFALCPFHSDNNPSLSISRDKQIFKCFVCNEAGNVFTFIQKYKKIPYMQAVKEVADMVGVEFALKENKSTEIIHPKLQVLYDILNDAKSYYASVLLSNDKAMEYCKNRDMNLEVLKEFSIGYSANSENIVKFLLAKGYSKEDIYRSGIVIENEGNLKDRFMNRLIFPITDVSGRVVAFSGRIIEKSDMAKYVNSPETEIFTKGDTLYHYASALSEIKKQKQMYICEGYMDCIALCKAGIYNSVALMGTAFTKEHLKLIKFLGVEVILTLDGDIPGNVNANKLANELESLNVSVKIIGNYKDAKDLDEYLKKYGKEDFLAHLKNTAVNVFEFSFFVASKVSDMKNNENKKKFLYSMCHKIAKLNETDRDLYATKLHDELGFSMSTINGLIRNELKGTSEETVIEKVNQYKKLTKYQDMQLRLLSQLLDDQEAIDMFVNSLLYLENDSYRKLSMIIGEYYKENKKSFSLEHMIADLFTKVSTEYGDDPELLNTLTMIDSVKENYPNYNKQSFMDLVFELKEIAPLEQNIERIQEDIKFANTIEEKNNLIRECLGIKALLQEKKQERNRRKWE